MTVAAKARRARDAWRRPAIKRAVMLLLAAEGLRWVLCDFSNRIGELEDRAQLGADLKALEDVATLGDLDRLRFGLDGRYVLRSAPGATPGGDHLPGSAPPLPD